MPKLKPSDLAFNMVSHQGPKEAYRILLSYSEEFIGKDRNVVNPQAGFYREAKNLVKKYFAKYLTEE